jgi:hypothetical protein
MLQGRLAALLATGILKDLRLNMIGSMQATLVPTLPKPRSAAGAA